MSPPIADFGFRLPGGPKGVLLIHGLTGTPAEMRVLAKGLNRAGFTVHVVQLAGHCGGVDDLVATRWTDWYASVCEAADALSAQTTQLYVGGLSMGALLALKYAAEHPHTTTGVMAYSPTFDHDGWSMPLFTRLGTWLLPLCRRLGLGRERVFEEQAPFGIKDLALRKLIVGKMQSGASEQAGLPGNPWYALVEFWALARSVKKQLRQIECPCLVVHAVDDDVASPANAQRIARALKQGLVHVHWLFDSYHMITIDKERRKVVAATVEFIAA